MSMSIETNNSSAAGAIPVAAHKAELWARLTGFQAPYLTDKLVRSGLASDDVAADALFTEVKRYLYLASTCSGRMPMISSVVDAAWHQFILFTAEYEQFCRDIWGAYQHHAPRSAAAGADPDGVTAQTLVESYHQTFGALPEVWHNERILHANTRLVRPDARERMFAQSKDGKAVLLRERARIEEVCRTHRRALPALSFVAEHTSFFVRELPGLLNDPERVALLAPLVQYDILNLAA